MRCDPVKVLDHQPWIGKRASEATHILLDAGRLFSESGDTQRAIAAYRLAAETDQDNLEALENLARLKLSDGRYAEGEEHLSVLLHHTPDDYSALLNMAIVHLRRLQHQSALLFAEAAVEKAATPDLTPEAFLVLARIHSATGDATKEILALDKGLKLFPQASCLREMRARGRLLNGAWLEGWEDFEYRRSKQQWLLTLDEIQEWDGSPLSTPCQCQAWTPESSATCPCCRGQGTMQKRLLVIGELNMHGQLFFSRYLSAIISRNPRQVILHTRPELARFFEPFGVSLITSDLELKSILESEQAPDLWISLPSVPRVLSITRPILPAVVGKSVINDRLPVIAPRPKSLRIGLAWRYDGKTGDQNPIGFSPDNLKALVASKHDFYSLQPGWDPQHGRVTDLWSLCHDAAELSTAIETLDLVITVDNTIAHLAGTLNKKTWLLYANSREWYWGRDGENTEWYPSVKVFRVASRGEADSLVGQLSAELTQAAAETKGLSIHPEHHSLRQTPDPLITKHCRYGLMSFYSTDHYVGHSLDLYGEYSEGEVGLFRHVVRGGDVVVEVGSNIGALTLPLSLLVGHQGVVHAFEPQTDIFEILKCNVETCKNVTLWNSALASHRASIRYATPRRDKICNPGNCELIIQGDSDPGALGSAQTLDDLFHDLPIALIKIDVEGMELDVLKGGNYILRRYRPLLYMEDDRPEKSRDLRSWLGAQGYRIYRHAPPLYNPRNWRNYQINVFGNTVSINLFCVPQERFDLGHITKRLVRLRQDSSSA